MGYSFKNEADIKRVVDATKTVEALGRSFDNGVITDESYLAEVKEIISSGTTSTEPEIKATEVVFTSDSDGKTEFYEPAEPMKWDSQDAGVSSYNIRYMKRQPIPAVGDIIEVFKVAFDIDTEFIEDYGWFFRQFKAGSTLSIAVVTGFVATGVTANIFPVGVTDFVNNPIAENVVIALSHAGSPVFLSIGEKFIVTAAGEEYISSGFLTI